MRALRLHTPQWNIRINMIAPSVTHTNILPGGSGEHYKNLGLYVQTAGDVARAVAYLAQTDSNGKTIAISQGLYRELEDTIDRLKDNIWGEEDFTPSEGPETEAFLMVQLNRW
jgi:NAD(P)-dependent dehydrogenase (short-subunit alcohol dehydrogenase family)